jgi:predicted N-acyltransferase
MLPLEAQLYAKYGHHVYPTEMARSLHESVIKEYGQKAQVITARSDGVLRGYAAFIQKNKTLYSRDAGFDYVWQQNLPLYYETVFYGAVELAARSDAREINYSYAAEETKAAHGCEVRSRWGYVKAFDEDVSRELKSLCADLDRAGASTAD